jgi:hypothetical protein
MENPILDLKEEIKKLSQAQCTLKPQRKTVYFEGERTVEPWEATYKHMSNRYTLRHMYLAYGLLRGKTIEQIESNRKTEYNERTVSKLVERYSPEAVRVSA